MNGDERNRSLFAYHSAYEDELGASMHLAAREADGKLRALNGSFGVLFPKADFAEGRRSGATKTLVNPWVFRLRDGSFGVAALRRNPGQRGAALPEPGREHCVLFFRSADLLSYEELFLIEAAPRGALVSDLSCSWDGEAYVLRLRTDRGMMESRSAELSSLGEARPGGGEIWRVRIGLDDSGPACEIPVSEAEYRRVVNRLLPLANTGLRRVESSGEAELLYGDGSSRRMPARREPWPFPLMGERGDPMAIRYRGRYYFMATDDEGGQLALKIREAASLGEIAGAEESVLLSARSEAEGCFWAPELHEIGGRLFLFFAVGSPHWYTVQCHAMALEGTDPTDPAAWSKPRRCVTREGKPLYEGGITLDMSVLDTKAGYYAVWARREIGEDLGDLGPSDLYIARIDPREPWRLASEAVLLRRPSYAWERAHSEVAEGPFLLKRGGELFLTYAAALIDHSYCVGLLRAKDGDELLEAASWSASNYPVLHRQSVPDQIGAGHNSFVKDEAGEDVLMIHAIPFAHYRNNPQDLRRYPAFRRVHWDAEGFPRLDMTPERELAPEVARLAAANPAREGDEG